LGSLRKSKKGVKNLQKRKALGMFSEIRALGRVNREEKVGAGYPLESGEHIVRLHSRG
jgi:hypothetical protein